MDSWVHGDDDIVMQGTLVLGGKKLTTFSMKFEHYSRPLSANTYAAAYD